MKIKTGFWDLAETMGVYLGSAGIGAVIGTVFLDHSKLTKKDVCSIIIRH